jgi:ABC-2 type transport system permease protein
MKLYFKFFAIHLKSEIAYPTAFFFGCLGRLLLTVNSLLGIVFLLNRFDTIGGYTLPEILLGYGVVLTASSLAECFARGFDAFSKILREAQFDRLLVRPRNLVFQVICQDLRPNMLPNILQGIAMLVYAVPNFQWTPVKAVVLLMMVVCGSLLFFGTYLVFASLCFFTLEGLEVMNIFTGGIREYSKYPFNIYGKVVLTILTVVVPMALVQYWPMLYLLGRGPDWYGLLPPISLIFLLPCYILWKVGVRHYCSTGS